MWVGDGVVVRLVEGCEGEGNGETKNVLLQVGSWDDAGWELGIRLFLEVWGFIWGLRGGTFLAWLTYR